MVVIEVVGYMIQVFGTGLFNQQQPVRNNI